jgi:hypothetical protein
MMCKPNTIVRQEEFEALRVHIKSFNFEDDRFAVTLPYTARCTFASRQVHVLAQLRFQAIRQDRVYEPRSGSVVQNLWRLRGKQAEFHRDGMPLRGANAQPIRRNREALLVTGRDHMQQVFAAEPSSDGIALSDNVVDEPPTLQVQYQAYFFGLVTEN